MVRHRKALWGLLMITTSVDAFWRMSCSLIQTGRVDPIISPGQVSGHVHKVSGASNFGMDSSYSDLQASRCTSCEIQDDKSAYWTPQLYYEHANGSFEMVPNGGTVVYYLGRGVNRTAIQPFPPGFKMLSGDSSARSNDAATMTYGTSAYPGRLQSDRVSFACLDSSGPMAEQKYMFRTDCDNGMRAQIQFQSCWNGDAYQSDQSHVAYMSQIDNGICPPTHPHLLPHLFFEVIYSVNNIQKSKGGRFVFANGDTTGYGFHGDFLNGWDTTVLTKAIKNCINNDSINGQISLCPVLAASQTPYYSTNCPERPPIVNETVSGMLSKLPGCNPVTSGPAAAPQQICAVEPSVNEETDSGTYMFNPAVGDKVGTWAYLGCAVDGSPRTLSTYATASDSMTIEYCTAACKAQGLPLAGLENSRECYCAATMTKGTSYMKAAACKAASKMICAGNETEWCGAPSLLTVWNDTSYKPPQTLVVGSTKIADGSATYQGCFSEATSGRALSSDSFVNATGMTNELCVAFCTKGGYTYAGTEYSQECYCGNTNAGTKIAHFTQCSMKCTGDILSYCGAGSKLSVWQITLPAESTTPITALGGTVEYEGCYTDEADGGRTLPSASFSGSTMSLETCAAFCQKGNYPLFGMEYASQCYCGFATKTQATLTSEGDCRMPCAGNSSEICGGSSRISVWSNKLYKSKQSSTMTSAKTTKTTTKTSSTSTTSKNADTPEALKVVVTTSKKTTTTSKLVKTTSTSTKKKSSTSSAKKVTSTSTTKKFAIAEAKKASPTTTSKKTTTSTKLTAAAAAKKTSTTTTSTRKVVTSAKKTSATITTTTSKAVVVKPTTTSQKVKIEMVANEVPTSTSTKTSTSAKKTSSTAKLKSLPATTTRKTSSTSTSTLILKKTSKSSSLKITTTSTAQAFAPAGEVLSSSTKTTPSSLSTKTRSSSISSGSRTTSTTTITSMTSSTTSYIAASATTSIFTSTTISTSIITSTTSNTTTTSTSLAKSSSASGTTLK